MEPSGWPTCRPSPEGYGNMSCTNILSSGTGEPSVGASEPTGLGTLKVPSRIQLSCQERSMAPASDPPTIDGLGWIADRSGVCPICIAGGFRCKKPPLPLVTVAFCDFDE